MLPYRSVVATVFEARQPFVNDVWILYRTLNVLGGKMREANKIAYCIGDLSAIDRDRLVSLGVSIRQTKVVDPRLPYANKLRMFQSDYKDADYLIALDNDIAVAGDISAWIGGSEFRAKPAEVDVLTLPQWQLVFSHFGLQMPHGRHMTHFQAKKTVTYFNSGVLFVPVRFVISLGAVWESYVRALSDAILDEGGTLPFIVPHPPLIDQLALALTVQHLGLPCKKLPLALNFPIHRPSVHPRFHPHKITPLLLHHHHRLDVDGSLRFSGYNAPDVAIALVNTAVKQSGRAHCG
jgi:hypothetical protein